MDIRIGGIIEESIVDGRGLRYTIFTQGCPRSCDGCHNPQTREFNGGKTIDTEIIIKAIRKNPFLDGVTFSGGEPFCQPLPLIEIAEEVRKSGLDVWCYTGYTFEELMNGTDEQKELLSHIDILVDGPFVLEKKTFNCLFRGSSNQRIIYARLSLKKGEVVEYQEEEKWLC